MKRLALCLLLALAACKRPDPDALRIIREPRTGKCFAVLPAGPGNGGISPALAGPFECPKEMR